MTIGSPSGSGAPLRWDGNYNISFADQIQYFFVGRTVLTDVNFSNDGSVMFVINNNSQRVDQYKLTNNFDTETASRVTEFTTSDEEQDPQGIAFNNTGDKMYVVGQNSQPSGTRVNQYSLGSSFDLSSVTFDKSFDVGSEENVPSGIAFNGNGSVMFITGGSEKIYEYDLSTGFDIGTASYSNFSFDVTAQVGNAQDITFGRDGLLLYVVARNDSKIYQYELRDNYQLFGGSFDQALDVSSSETTPLGMTFSKTGNQMYVVGADNNRVYEYSVGEPAGVY